MSTRTAVEIFRTGVHRGFQWTKSHLEEIAKNFSEWSKSLLKHPLVLGHDEEQPLLQNSGMPALGWVDELAIRDNLDGTHSLMSYFTDVPEKLKEAVGKNRYKRISAEIYEDYANQNLDGGKPKGKVLRRVSILGADIPEVKNMDDVVALDENRLPGILMVDGHTNDFEREKTMPDDKKIEAKEQVSTEQFAELMKKVDGMGQSITKLQEENATLTKQNAELKGSNEKLVQAHAKVSAEKRSAEIGAFIEAQKRAGKVLPKMEEAGLARFMESLDDAAVLKFGEGDKAVTKSQAVLFRELLESMPQLVKLGEGTKDDLKAAAEDKAAGEKMKGARLDAAIKKYMEERKQSGVVVTYGEALRTVAKLQPELAK